MHRKVGRIVFMLAFYSLGLAYGLTNLTADLTDSPETAPVIIQR